MVKSGSMKASLDGLSNELVKGSTKSVKGPIGSVKRVSQRSN